MDLGFAFVLAVGFLIGLKHALEPDHVIAVSTIAVQSQSLWRSALAGLYWGIGHSLTLFLVGMAVLLTRKQIPEAWTSGIEFLVGLLLIYLGLSTFFSYRRKRVHAHLHWHGDVAHTHFHAHGHGDLLSGTGASPAEGDFHTHTHSVDVSRVKSLLLGCVHGLAGSAALVLLTLSTVDHWSQGLAYILVFGLGTVGGMFLFTLLLGVPFALSARRGGLHRVLVRLTGLVSCLYGCYYMYEFALAAGLF